MKTEALYSAHLIFAAPIQAPNGEAADSEHAICNSLDLTPLRQLDFQGQLQSHQKYHALLPRSVAAKFSMVSVPCVTISWQ
jgi:hypothetical protein